jgi:hypothetical protein
LDNQNNLSSSVNRNIPKTPNNVKIKTEISPVFYLSSEDPQSQILKDSSSYKVKKNCKETDNMRGTSLRNGGRPANSMEQDSFDSFDDMEDMLVVSTTNSLNLNNPSLR